MDMTTVEIPSELLAEARLSPEDVRTELAMALFRQGRIPAYRLEELAGDTHRMEEAFQKKDRTGQIDLDAFVSWAAHDLRSPLNAIIGFTKVVLKGIDGPVSELQVTDLTSAHSSGQRMLTLINNLIDMARMNTGQLKTEFIPGDLFQTVVDAATRWKTQNPAKELHTEIGINVPIFSFDPTRLRQIITGLLTYSANYVAEGGTVSLTVREEDHKIIFEIASSGEKARDVYEMDLTMNGFICGGLIRLHGGDLKIGEDSGHGLALSFWLPGE